VLTTIDDGARAASLARSLVEDGLAACVSRTRVASTYRWEGAVEAAEEELLIIKTAADCGEALRARLAELHPYDVPEIVAVEPSFVAAPYLAWLLDACPPAG
jgi:periplasmic divalent cation tolerance protein